MKVLFFVAVLRLPGASHLKTDEHSYISGILILRVAGLRSKRSVPFANGIKWFSLLINVGLFYQ